ncbi:unnamed protein product [Cuscuta epithymum]|uniref:Uncharacterized protein n=1 Tax=Cuscuta epithymum TaxID=186058 RepID=A0AAV0F6W3_9ASTE|nr:unnamed protein product [Cuscuta epithymum]
MVQSSSTYNYLQESISSLCKNLLQKRRLPAIAAAEERLSKQQSGNLKWQQDSFHHILNLMGLCKEGIVPHSQLSAFRSHLLDSLVADHDHSSILRDKLIFLQELLYSNCISEEEYHSSKGPLLQRLAAQGAEIEARNVIVRPKKQSSEQEWSVIDLEDENPNPKQNRGEKQTLWLSTENPFWRETNPNSSSSFSSGGGGEKSQKKKKKALSRYLLFGAEEVRGMGFGGLRKKWNRAESKDETDGSLVGVQFSLVPQTSQRGSQQMLSRV